MNPSPKSPTVKALFGHNQNKSSLASSVSLQQTKPATPVQKQTNVCCEKTVLICFRKSLDLWHPKKKDKDPYRGREYSQLCDIFQEVFGKEPPKF